MPVVPITEAQDRPITFDERIPHTTLLMITPDTYRIGEHINPHMGGQADNKTARFEWEALYQLYANEMDVETLNPIEYYEEDDGLRNPSELPDIVFAANQTLVNSEAKQVVLSNMATEQRLREEEYLARFFERRGWSTYELPKHIRFEGAGDAIWHPNRNILWGGYGIRSDKEAYEYIAEEFDTTVYTIPLTDEKYYHLDTCFMPLDEETVLIAEDAFDGDVRTSIDHLFETVLVVPKNEANELACNVHALNDDLIFMGDGAPETRSLLEDAGFTVRTVSVSEFNKAGGGVFCLRQTF